MSEFVISRITAAAQRLKPPHMAAAAADAATRAEQSQLGYLEFLDQLLEEEVTHRESGRFGRRARGSPDCRTGFFSLLQNNVLDRGSWATRDELRGRDRALDRTDLSPP